VETDPHYQYNDRDSTSPLGCLGYYLCQSGNKGARSFNCQASSCSGYDACPTCRTISVMAILRLPTSAIWGAIYCQPLPGVDQGAHGHTGPPLLMTGSGILLRINFCPRPRLHHLNIITPSGHYQHDLPFSAVYTARPLLSSPEQSPAIPVADNQSRALSRTFVRLAALSRISVLRTFLSVFVSKYLGHLAGFGPYVLAFFRPLWKRNTPMHVTRRSQIHSSGH